jgi:hypothetical protein
MKRVVFVWSGCLLFALALATPTALGSANANWGTGVEATLPGDAGTNPGVELRSVSCPSAGNCAAVGDYDDTTGFPQGLLLSESSGTWAQGVEAMLPMNANATPNVFINSVSCPSAGNCSAVGGYTDNIGNRQGLLLSESSGTWAQGVELAPPAGASSDLRPNIQSVSCPSAGNCSAVGRYADSSGHFQGVLLTESSGLWAQGVEATLPAGANATPNVFINSVSCPSAGNCSAVGSYADSSSHGQGLLLSESGGTWAAIEASPPANAGTNPNANVGSVSCPSAGNCSAIGTYEDSSSHFQGVFLSEDSGTWATTPGLEASLPPDAGTDPSVNMNSVSCPSAGNCSAVGSYSDNSFNQLGLLLSESAGTWAAGIAATPPAASPDFGPSSVSCPSAGNCGAVGFYEDGSFNDFGLLLTESSGTWGSGIQPVLPANADPTNPNAFASSASVSCPSVGNCAAVGSYTDSSSNTQGLLLDASPVSPALGASAPSSGTPGSAIPASAIAATLSSGMAPIGTIDFKVFGPQASAPSSCGSGGTAVGSASVSGNATYHPSTGFTPPSAGTYWWYASYGGDASDNAAASTCGASMAHTVAKASPTLSTTASAGVKLGAAVHDTANLAFGQSPGGQITFRLYRPGDTTCSQAPVYTNQKTVVGNGGYISANYKPTKVGTYRWKASYSGDANNNSLAGTCGGAHETVTVAKATPTLSTTASASVKLGGKVHDTARLSAGQSPTGKISFRLYGPGDSTCSKAPRFTTTKTVSGNGSYTSVAFTPTATGTYRWRAFYSGDANNAAKAGACNAPNEAVTVTKG